MKDQSKVCNKTASLIHFHLFPISLLHDFPPTSSIFPLELNLSRLAPLFLTLEAQVKKGKGSAVKAFSMFKRKTPAAERAKQLLY